MASLFEGEAHSCGTVTLEVRSNHRDHIVGLLARHEAARDLHVRIRRKNRLAPGPLIAAVHPVHLNRRPIPLTRERAVAWFTETDRRADVGEIPPFVERQTIERVQKRRLDRVDVVVESVDSNPSPVVERGDQCGGRVKRVRDAAAVTARVESFRGPRTVKASDARPAR